MASIAGAISALVTFASGVTGITHSYDLSATPRVLSPTQLPCAVIDFGPEDAASFKQLTYLGNAPVVEFDVTQIVLVDTSAQKTLDKVMPTVVTILDNYLLAMKANPFYTGGTLPTAPAVHSQSTFTPKIGGINFSGVDYFAIWFKHHMRIFL